MDQPTTMLKHFSHEHPLKYIESSADGGCVCSACKLAIMPRNFFYQCKLCGFSLHKVCYSMPKKVMHPADPNHWLKLSTPSTVLEKPDECEACGRHIAGYYYSCTECPLSYHMLCVAMPLSVKIMSSHPHVLKLEFRPVYDFKCDVCDMPRFNGWHYHCRMCEFDAHVSCAVKGAQPLLKDDGTNGSKSHQHELMELLSEQMKHVEVKNANNLDLDRDHHLQSLDQLSAISEVFTLPSCQFSDACFSLDVSKPIPIERNKNEWSECDSKQNNEKLQLLKRQSFSFGMKDLKREVTLAPSTGICTPVWDEMGRENENRNANAANNIMLFKDQAKETETRLEDAAVLTDLRYETEIRK
ncbi:uncharacterized protein LOC125206298 [Salvia hispanica]|uniref:uncharacterized protein LOC125206298 n=1 Tax=Salvia hispanica TaxID=49212 RepID=UPI00200965E9|nr:uncharacterized protein LOC125206298 [Salvia hispanica]